MKSICVVLTVLCSLRTTAQVDGLWVVKNVEVGGQLMTPVAKWFRFSNGTLLSGNGWQQHSVGSYKWDKLLSSLSLESTNEPSDGFGPFLVERKGNTMTWTRTEEGEEVKVLLETATDLPKSTADETKGLWDLVQAKRAGVDVTLEVDPELVQFIFLRWDRVFVKKLNSKERVQGYWLMNGHRPEIKFIHEQSPENNETWTVAFEEGNLMLTGVSDNTKGMVLTYSRLSAFPN